MAATLNKVFLMGNLTRDPDVKQTPSGETVADLGLAVSEQFRSRTTNETREVVTFVDVTVWGKTAENCGQYLTKGRPIFVEGRLVMDTWEDKATGQKRTRLRVRADRVQFLSAPDRSRREGTEAGAQPAPQPQHGARPSTWQAPPRASQSVAAPPAPGSADAGDLEDLPF